MKARSAGIYAVALSEFETAQLLFADASRYFISHLIEVEKWRDEIVESYWYEEPQVFQNACYCALWSGDPNLPAKIAEQAKLLEQSYLEKFPNNSTKYYRAQALANILRGNDASDDLQRLDAALANEETPHTAAVAMIYRGLVNSNDSTLQPGIQQLITQFEERADPASTNSSDLFAFTATAFLVLVRQQGFEFDVDSDFIPKNYIVWLLGEST
ncbi:hypothetical protein [Haloprofundus salilacus]|uniref:hypothetical protein n=1 Tax=Haloprofundus salilacus TaxID=2876190 RepID=UPI001CCC46BF|nr:hypothetical protein [Haloprofundus salilacus]